MFGLSTTYWMALFSRFCLGAFCGTLGPMRVYSPYIRYVRLRTFKFILLSTNSSCEPFGQAYASEVSRREHQALGLGMV